jgi:hypothetical protein
MTKKLCDNVLAVEKKIYRVERLLWYVAGLLSFKFGTEAIPSVMAMFG